MSDNFGRKQRRVSEGGNEGGIRRDCEMDRVRWMETVGRGSVWEKASELRCGLEVDDGLGRKRAKLLQHGWTL